VLPLLLVLWPGFTFLQLLLALLRVVAPLPLARLRPLPRGGMLARGTITLEVTITSAIVAEDTRSGLTAALSTLLSLLAVSAEALGVGHSSSLDGNPVTLNLGTVAGGDS
jgi:hypothetical protein